MPNAELLYVPGCPNVDLARRRLVEAAACVEVEVVVRDRLVIDVDAAMEFGMSGSPTILIDGCDVASNAAPSMSCRLYPTASGLDGAPSVDALVAALER